MEHLSLAQMTPTLRVAPGEMSAEAVAIWLRQSTHVRER
jgi:hypothetical protein